MKVLQVYPYYPPAWEFGGALRVVHQLSTRLVDRGYDVTVFTTDTYGDRGRVGETDRVDVPGLEVRYFPNVSNWLAHRFHLPIPRGLRRALDETIHDYDLVHVHGVPHLLAVGVTRAARRHDVPYIVTPHGTINQPNEDDPPLPRRLFNHAFAEDILSSATTVTALTDDEVSRLEATDIELQNVVKIPNGIDVEEIQSGDGDDFSAKHDLEGTRLVGFVGRLHEKKGIDIVTDCAAHFRDDSDVAFVLIGPDDGYANELRRLIRERGLDNVTLLGYVSEFEKQSALDAMDVFLHPSYSEGQPMAVLEACATGTPVVISDRCALPEVADAEGGMVTPPEVGPTIAALRKLLEDDDLREEMGTNAAQLATEAFTWESVVDAYETLYRDIVSNNVRDRTDP